MFWFQKIRNWFSKFVPILLSYVNYNASRQQGMMCWVEIGGPSISAVNVKPERIQKDIDSVSVSSNWGPHLSRKREQRPKTTENEDLSPSYGVTNAVVVVTCKIKGSLKLNHKYTILSLLIHTLTFVTIHFLETVKRIKEPIDKKTRQNIKA